MNPLHQAVGEICNRREKAGNVGRLQSWLDSSCAGPGGLAFRNDTTVTDNRNIYQEQRRRDVHAIVEVSADTDKG